MHRNERNVYTKHRSVPEKINMAVILTFPKTASQDLPRWLIAVRFRIRCNRDE